MRRLAFVLIVILGLVWIQTAFVAVEFTKYVYVTRFGAPVAIYDGRTDAGLHWKLPWPIESYREVDRRLHIYTLPTIETLTRDAGDQTVDKTIAIESFVIWRVPDAQSADRFIRTLVIPENVERILTNRINGRLASIVSSMTLNQLIAELDEIQIEIQRKALQSKLLDGGDSGRTLRIEIQEEYGIEIVDAQIKRLTFPEAVRASIAERIRSERARKIAEYESEGRRRAAEIVSLADKEARRIEASARAEKVRIEGQADVEADRIRSEAYSKNPEFYQFLQKLKSYQVMISEARDTIILSAKHPLFDLLLNPPGANSMPRREP